MKGWRASEGRGEGRGWWGRERRLAGEPGEAGKYGGAPGQLKAWQGAGDGWRGRVRTGEDCSSPTRVTQQRARAGRRGRAASPLLGYPPPRGSVMRVRRGGAWAGRSSSVSQPPTLSGPASALAPSRESQEWVEEERFSWICPWLGDQAAYGGLASSVGGHL